MADDRGSLQLPGTTKNEPTTKNESQTECDAAELIESELLAGVPVGDMKKVEKYAEQLRRREMDQELHARLLAADFDGPLWNSVQFELASYGLAVFSAWLYTGHVYKLAAEKRVPVVVSEAEINLLATSPQERDDLANFTVAEALRKFKERSLEGRRGWTFEGGASITTYFMGACLLAFPNELRRRRTNLPDDARLVNPADLSELQETVGNHPFGSDPSVEVTNDDAAKRLLAEMKPRTRRIAVLTLMGYSQEEILEILDETSIPAIQGVLHRLRKNPKIRSYLGDRHDS